MKFKELYFHTAVIAICGSFVSSVAFADTVNADIQDHYKTVIEQDPYTVEVCKDVKVPVDSGTNTEGAIVGGIIGGIIGNQIGGGSGKEAATGVGALTGAIIGGNSNRNQGTRTERQCQTETRYEERERTVYSHSTITFRENGRNYTLKFNR